MQGVELQQVCFCNGVSGSTVEGPDVRVCAHMCVCVCVYVQPNLF